MQETTKPLGVRDQLLLILIVVGVLLSAWITLRSIDPPWDFRTLHGSVVRSGFVDDPNRVIRYYKTEILARTDDHRLVVVASGRTTLPVDGAQIAIQERIGLLGTRTFVEVGDQ